MWKLRDVDILISQIFPVCIMFASNKNNSSSNNNLDADITAFPDLSHIKCVAEYP